MPLPALMVSDSTSDQHLFPELLVPKCNTSQWIKSFPLYTNTTHPSNLLPNNESLANPQMFQIKLEPQGSRANYSKVKVKIHNGST